MIYVDTKVLAAESRSGCMQSQWTNLSQHEARKEAPTTLFRTPGASGHARETSWRVNMRRDGEGSRVRKRMTSTGMRPISRFSRRSSANFTKLSALHLGQHKRDQLASEAISHQT